MVYSTTDNVLDLMRYGNLILKTTPSCRDSCYQHFTDDVLKLREVTQLVTSRLLKITQLVVMCLLIMF